MIISGKIHKLIEINKDITNVILLKTRKKKPYFVSILFYFHLSDVIKSKYQENDFVKIWFRLRSNQRQTPQGEKYYTDVIGDKIVLVRRDGMSIEPVYNDFNLKVKNKYVNKETGEIIEVHSVLKAIKENPKR
jgi:hypothetical protein|tara:strand:+ start:1710 stop:2108 length:399 start_codon:yes stop_codon:yes gene_type:complete